MKTFLILAAGRGSRFGGDKLLEPINGSTLPQRCALFALANGAERLCVTVSRSSVLTNGNAIYHPVVEDIRRVVDNQIDVEVSFQAPDCYGPGAAITAWEGKISDDFIVLFGDNLYEGFLPSFDPLITHFSYKTLPTHPRNLQLAAVIDDYIIEKPHAQLSGKFFCGFAHFPIGFFDQLPAMQRSSRDEYEITDMLNLAKMRVPMDLGTMGIKWADITYKSDLQTLEDMTL